MKKSLFLLLLFLAAAALSFADNITFCYHKFGYAMEDIYSTLPEVLEWQIKYLKDNKIPIIHMNEFVDIYKNKKDMGDNALLTADDGWKSDVDILPVLDRQMVPMTMYLIASVIKNGAKDYLNPFDLRILMADKWVEYGCHTNTHPVMTKLDDAGLKYEVNDSKAALEAVTGTTLNTFAYPYGILNKKVENYVKQYYDAAFGVNDGVNRAGTNLYNVNRFVIYRNTTFGEFMGMCGYLKEVKADDPYSVRDIGESDEYGKRILFPRIKYYKFRAKEGNNGNVLFIPGSYMGAGWNYKTIRKLTASGTQCGAIVNRNNNLPFYRPEKNTMKVLQGWGLKTYMEDTVKAFDMILLKEDKTVIVTWGDGFDLVMAVLASTDKYNSKIRGIIVINPSFPEADAGGSVYRANIDKYNKQLAAGEHAAESIEYFLKIKTLSDMVVLEPEAVSRFTQKMGYKGEMTNKELLENVLNDEDHPDLGIDYSHSEYTLDDFKEAFMQPVPLFSMVVPIAFLRDLNDLWLNNFMSAELGIVDAKNVELPVSYIYSDSYGDAVKKVRSVRGNLAMVSVKQG
jgi:peptidoglycan/xylan/chitin deacetylase (PgdA/CDA1 family)